MNLEGEEMPFDFKKEYKEFYKPKNKPDIGYSSSRFCDEKGFRLGDRDCNGFHNGYLFAGKWVCE